MEEVGQPPFLNHSYLAAIDGLVMLLKNIEINVKIYALKRLHDIVDTHSHDIIKHLPLISQVAYDPNFPQRELAILLIARLYFFTGNRHDALETMMLIPQVFINGVNTEFCESLAIGIALELRQMDLLKSIISRQPDPKILLKYIVTVITRFFDTSTWKTEVYEFVINELFKQNPLDYTTLFYCLLRAKKSSLIGETLLNLAINNEHNIDNCSIATQLCFDLHENAMPSMIEEILISIKQSDLYRDGKKITFESSSKKKQKTPSDGLPYTSVVLEQTSNLPPSTNIDHEFLNSEIFLSMNEKQKEECLNQMDNEYRMAHLKYIYQKLTKFIIILRGKATARLWFEYIIKTMKSDGHILRLLRSCVKSSLSMTAIIFANAIMHCGTTGDSFAREHAEWFGRCSNWSKFAYVVGYGIIHSGNHTEGMRVLGSFLPRRQGGNIERKYEESGALCALGFIFGNRSSKVKEFIQCNFYAADDSVIFHGCCLGFGLTCFGNIDLDILNYLLTFLENTDPIKSLGASICYGLISIGIYDHFDFNYIKNILLETKHEKTKLGLSILLSCAYAQTGFEALIPIKELLLEKRGACHLAAAYMLGLAFVGTGDIGAVKMLWELVIFDVDEHVKRAAVISLAFVLLQDKPQFYDIMTQLFNSHHPMVRCASAFALGIVFAGTGHPDAYVLITHLFMDFDVRVRQAAYISAAMIMMHLNETKSSSVKAVRESLIAVITNSKSIDQLVRFGAILGIGIIDAGGKNMVINYFTSDGSVRIQSIVGMFLFGMSYYWYPLIGYLSLSFVPSAIIAVKDDFSIPVIKLISNKSPNYFKYASFNHQSRRSSRNKTSLRLSSHRKSRKSKKSSFVMSIVSPHKNQEKIQNIKDEGDKQEILNNSNIDKMTLENEVKNDKEQKTNIEIMSIDQKTNIEIISVDQNNDQKTNIEIMSVDQNNDQKANIEIMSVDQITDDKKKVELKSCIADNRKSGNVQKDKISNDKVTFDIPENETQVNEKNTVVVEGSSTETTTTLYNPSRVLPHLFSSVKMEENSGYFSFKPINSGGIVVVKKVGTGPETLVLEPLQVKIVSSKCKPVSESLPLAQQITDIHEQQRIPKVTTEPKDEKQEPPKSDS